MNAEEYIQAVIAKNPALGKSDDEKVTMTVRGVKNLIKQAHETGYKYNEEVREKIKKLFRVPYF